MNEEGSIVSFDWVSVVGHGSVHHIGEIIHNCDKCKIIKFESIIFNIGKEWRRSLKGEKYVVSARDLRENDTLNIMNVKLLSISKEDVLKKIGVVDI